MEMNEMRITKETKICIRKDEKVVDQGSAT